MLEKLKIAEHNIKSLTCSIASIFSGLDRNSPLQHIIHYIVIQTIVLVMEYCSSDVGALAENTVPTFLCWK